MSKPKNSNPVVEVYKGIVIRRYQKITIRLSAEAIKQIIDTQETTNLSAAQILGHSSKPCDCCKGLNVTTFNSDNEKVFVPRGILFKSTLTKHGSYLTRKSTDSNGQSDRIS